MSLHPNTFSVELCPKCHSFLPLTSYSPPFFGIGYRGYINPPQSEVSVIESMLSAPTSQIADLAAEILRVGALLATLKRHHTQLETHIQRSRIYIKPSPIRQLPTEILDLIFSAACTSFDVADYKTPLNISLVCSKWRDIALSNPAWWTHIYLGSSLHAREMFDYYLQRCGKLPISIKIDQPLRHLPPAVDHGDAALPVEKTFEYHSAFMIDISRMVEQWKVAELHVGSEDFDMLMPDLSFPILESLTLALKGDVNELVLPEALSSHAPVLTNLVLLDSSGDDEQLVWEDCMLPSASLLTIRTNREDLSDLPTLQFSDDHNDATTLTVCSRCRFLPSSVPLEELWITNLILNPAPGPWTFGLTSFLKAASIPYLEALTIICPDRNDALIRDLLRAVPKLLENSDCALESFSFVMNGTDRPRAATQPTMLANTLLKVFRGMVWLKSLRIVEPIYIGTGHPYREVH